MQPVVVSEEPISMPVMRDGILRVKKRDNDPNFRVVRTDEYLTAFVGMSAKDAAELADRLLKLNIPRLRDVHVCKIVDVVPTDPNDLKMVLQGYSITVSNENLKKIVDVVAEYVK